MITEFSRNGITFKCCISSQPNEFKTPKQLFDEQIGDWLMVNDNGCHIMYILRNVIERRSYPKKAVVYYDIESLVPDMSANTRGGRELNVYQEWTNTPLINYFETFAMDGIGKAKRGINGLLEKVFQALPIFDPMGAQEVILDESAMLTRVTEFQTLLATDYSE